MTSSKSRPEEEIQASSPPSKGHRITLWFLTLMFVAFAALQFNDPDPLIWVSIYLCAALPCFVAVYKRFHWAIPQLLMLCAFTGAIFLWPKEYQGITGKMEEHPSIELARESLGLLICAAAMIYVGLLQFRK